MEVPQFASELWVFYYDWKNILFYYVDVMQYKIL